MLIYLQISAMQLKTFPILVIADTSVIKSDYYMVGLYCYVYNDKNYVINILNCIIVSCYKRSSYDLNSSNIS